MIDPLHLDNVKKLIRQGRGTQQHVPYWLKLTITAWHPGSWDDYSCKIHTCQNFRFVV